MSLDGVSMCCLSAIKEPLTVVLDESYDATDFDGGELSLWNG